MSDRFSKAVAFIETSRWAGIEPVLFAGDASARRYFRLQGTPTAILMDAPPDAGQDVAGFSRLAKFLNEAGFSAPEIYAEDHRAGFLLIEDFGDGVFARLAETDRETESRLYALANQVILALHDTAPPPNLPIYRPADMARMISPAFEWYRWAAGGPAETPARIIEGIQAVLEPIPAGRFSLRDFHAENLILLQHRSGLRRAGLLDFQDAMVGPACYDLVSLLYDVRRDVSESVIKAELLTFARHVQRDLETIKAWCAALSLQRNLRILGVFTRLALKAGKPRYLDFLPRVWRYVDSALDHPDVIDLATAIRAELPAPTPALIEDLRRRCGTVPNR